MVKISIQEPSLGPLRQKKKKSAVSFLQSAKTRWQSAVVAVKKYPKVSIIAAIMIAAGLGGGFFLVWRAGNPSAAMDAQTRDLVAKVSKLVVLPTNETPTIATVQDPEKLKGQPFFAHAKVGDKVLIYTKSQKAILYDPVANKIIEIAPIGMGGSAP